TGGTKPDGFVATSSVSRAVVSLGGAWVSIVDCLSESTLSILRAVSILGMGLSPVCSTVLVRCAPPSGPARDVRGALIGLCIGSEKVGSAKPTGFKRSARDAYGPLR